MDYDVLYSISDNNEKWRFRSNHVVHIPVAGGKHLITRTGIVQIDARGKGAEGNAVDWNRSRVAFKIDITRDFWPPNMDFAVEMWSPFVTINVVSDDGNAFAAGWAIDDFGMENPPYISMVDGLLLFWADIAVRHVDAWLQRIAYSITILGSFIPTVTKHD